MSEGLKKSPPPKASTPPAEEDGPVSVSPAGELVLSARLLARAALGPGAPVVVEAGRDGVRIVPDSLDKVHLEVISHCNLDCPPCFHCGGCPLTESNAEDCYNNPAPVCGECLWAQNIVLCP